MSHAAEIANAERFEFGANWTRFLKHLTDARIRDAEQSLKDRVGDLAGKSFLDIGSGSGLFSLAAHRLGATVHSFDYDPRSVACTNELKSRYGDTRWTVEQGSALDAIYLARLGKFDVVYSWGVLHHTGNMWRACENVAPLVRPGGTLFIAIYNDQGWRSAYWTLIKRWYNSSPVAKALLITAHLPLLAARLIVRTLTGRLSLERGMSLWHDYIDWLGGYPFQVASHQAIVDFFGARNFTLQHFTHATSGCSEFVFIA